MLWFFALCFIIAIPTNHAAHVAQTKSSAPGQRVILSRQVAACRIRSEYVRGRRRVRVRFQLQPQPHLDRAPAALLALALWFYAELTTLCTQTSVALCMRLCQA